jgi:GNAT superfamily N-acetyltransferase
MTAGLRFLVVRDDETLLDWQRVHNAIIPTAPLSLDDVRERSGRNMLENAYDGDVLVGNSTIRPPSDETAAVTVIARVLPEYRRRGFGEAIYQRCLVRSRDLGGAGVETHILASNEDGLRFATAHGFVEVETYLLPGDTIPFVELRLDV